MVKGKMVLILLLGLLALTGCDKRVEERDKAIAEAEEVKAELSKAEAELASVKSELSNVKAALEELGDKRDELKEELSAVSESQGKDDSELTTLTQAYNDLLKQVNGLSNERDMATARAEEAGAEVERLIELLIEKTNEVSKYTGVVGELQATGEKLEEREPDVIFVPTPQEVVDKMLELANLQKGDLVYDLGCGDGRIVVTAARKYGCKAMGYDIDPKRVKESLENVEKNNVKHLVSIERKDIFTLDFSKANVITLYLLPKLNVQLIPQLEKLKPGSRIVSHDFDMEGVKPDKVINFVSEEDGEEHYIYLWTTPLNKENRQGYIE